MSKPSQVTLSARINAPKSRVALGRGRIAKQPHSLAVPRQGVSLWERLCQWDRRTSLSIHSHYGQNGPGRWLLSLLELSGHGVLWLAGVALFFFLDQDLSNDQAVMVLNTWLGLIIDILLVSAIKLTVARQRPHWEKNQKQFATVPSIDQFSFPSGHTTRAFFLAAMAVLAAVEHLLPPSCAMLLCVWALILAMSRVAMGRHFVFDVAGGALVGLFEMALVVAIRVEWATASRLRQSFNAVLSW